MSLAFQSKTFNFSSAAVKSQLRKVPRDWDENTAVEFPDRVTFDHPVRDAQAVLKGVHLTFEDGDHNFAAERIGVRDVRVDGKTVHYTILCYIGDEDYFNPDHAFHGAVDILTLAKLAGKGAGSEGAVDFAETTVTFNSSSARKRVQPGFVQFGRRVRWAEAMLKAIRMEYLRADEDYFIQRAGVENVRISDDVVDFDSYFTLQDVTVYRGEDPASRQKETMGEFQVVVVAGLA